MPVSHTTLVNHIYLIYLCSFPHRIRGKKLVSAWNEERKQNSTCLSVVYRKLFHPRGAQIQIKSPTSLQGTHWDKILGMPLGHNLRKKSGQVYLDVCCLGWNRYMYMHIYIKYAYGILSMYLCHKTSKFILYNYGRSVWDRRYIIWMYMSLLR